MVVPADVSEQARLAGYRKRFGRWRPAREFDQPPVDKRLAAIGGLASVDRPADALEVVALASADGDERIRAAAVAAAGDIARHLRNEPGAAEGVLVGALHDPAASVRVAAARALGSGRFAGPEVASRLRAALDDASREVQQAAAVALGHTIVYRDEIDSLAAAGTPAALVALAGVAVVTRGEPATRADAALRAVARAQPEVFLAAVDLLVVPTHGGGTTTPETRWREHLLDSLAGPTSAALAPELARRMARRPSDLTRALAHLLATTKAPDAAPALLDLLADASTRGSGSDPRHTAFDGLTTLGAEIPVDLLTSVVRTSDGWLRQEGLRRLAHEHPGALADLVGEDPSLLGRQAAAALAPVIARETPTAARVAAWLATREVDEVLRWLDDPEASALHGFVLARLHWLDTDEAVGLAAALLAHGAGNEDPAIERLVAEARRMAATADHEEKEMEVGDQTVYTVTVVVDEEDTRARGRRYLTLLGATDPSG